MGAILGGTERTTAVESSNWGTATSHTVTRTVADDGAGNIGGGTINYGTGDVVLPVQAGYSAEAYSLALNGGVESGSWGSSSQTEAIDGDLTCTYALAATTPGTTETGEIDIPPLEIQLLKGVQDEILPGTLRFRLGTIRYSDREGGGLLYWDNGTVVGSVDYARRTALVTNWAGATTTVTILSCVSAYGQFKLKQAAFRTAGAPLAPGSFQVLATEEDGDQVTGTGQENGSITGTGIATGTIEHDIGAVLIDFTNPVYPSTLNYSATAYTIVPLQPDVIGVDPVRLPPDGRVPKLRAGDYVVVYEDDEVNAPNPLLANDEIDLGVERIAFAVLLDGAGEQTEVLPSGLVGAQEIILDTNSRTGPLEYCVLEDARARPVAGGLYSVDMATWTVTMADPLNLDGYEEPLAARFLPLVHPDAYEVDTDTGVITMADPLVLTGYTQPIKIRYRWHDLSLVVEAQTTGTVTLQSALTHAYTTAAALSAMLLHGDLQARYANLFAQHTWSTNWLDYLSGDPPTGGGVYDDTAYPIQVTNDGAIRERWRLKRRSDGQWDVVGETLGVIGIWNGTSTLEAKRVPSQAIPYFKVFHLGLGSGWATGNFIQFETFPAQGPLWVLRCVRPGTPSVAIDSLRLRHRVGAD